MEILHAILLFSFPHLSLLGGDGGIPVDELCEHASEGLDSQGQGRHVQQQDVRHVSSQHSSLDRCSHGNRLIWVDRLAGRASEQILNQLLDL